MVSSIAWSFEFFTCGSILLALRQDRMHGLVSCGRLLQQPKRTFHYGRGVNKMYLQRGFKPLPEGSITQIFFAFQRGISPQKQKSSTGRVWFLNVLIKQPFGLYYIICIKFNFLTPVIIINVSISVVYMKIRYPIRQPTLRFELSQI